MKLTSEMLRTLKGKVVTFNDGVDDDTRPVAVSLFWSGMKARVTNVKDISKPWWQFFRPAVRPAFEVVFDYREFVRWNRMLAARIGFETIWTAKEEIWLKSGKSVGVLYEGDDVFDVDEWASRSAGAKSCREPFRRPSVVEVLVRAEDHAFVTEH
jgi:hypothetical protein